MSQILVVGSTNLDLVIRTGRLPGPGETVSGGDIQTYPGGKGANQAVAAALMGGDVTMIGRVGDDHYGTRLRESLSDAGVEISRVMVTPATPTGVAFIVVEESGENIIVISPGANGKLSPEDVGQSEELFEKAGWVLLQLESPMETVTAAIAAAGRHGAKVILNPAPARELPADLLSGIDYLIPNQTEASLLSGVPVSDPRSAEDAARKLLDLGARTVIITMGGNGSLVMDREHTAHIPAPQVEAVDATAAGDAFVGGFTVGLTRSLPLDEAVRYANACGALAVTRAGAQAALPRKEEVDDFMNKQCW